MLLPRYWPLPPQPISLPESSAETDFFKWAVRLSETEFCDEAGRGPQSPVRFVVTIPDRNTANRPTRTASHYWLPGSL